MSMSRDSLNGTVTGTHLFQSIDHRREQAMSPVESARADQTTPTQDAMDADRPPSARQPFDQETPRREHEQEKPEEQSMSEPELVAAFERSQSRAAAHERPRTPSARVSFLCTTFSFYTFCVQKTPQQENNKTNASLNSSRRSSASSTARQRRTPVQSSLPPTPHTDEVIEN
jgi:hypothetical protein